MLPRVIPVVVRMLVRMGDAIVLVTVIVAHWRSSLYEMLRAPLGRRNHALSVMQHRTA